MNTEELKKWPENAAKKKRTRRNYKTVVDRLVQYCELSIAVLEPLASSGVTVYYTQSSTNNNNPILTDTVSPQTNYYSGKVDALKAILAQVESK